MENQKTAILFGAYPFLKATTDYNFNIYSRDARATIKLNDFTVQEAIDYFECLGYTVIDNTIK